MLAASAAFRDLQRQSSQELGLPERQCPHWAAAEHWQRRRRQQQGCSASPETLQKPCRLLSRQLFPQCCTSAERPQTGCSSSPQGPLQGHRLQGVSSWQQLACCVWGLHCAAGLRGLWALRYVCPRVTAAQKERGDARLGIAEYSAGVSRCISSQDALLSHRLLAALGGAPCCRSNRAMGVRSTHATATVGEARGESSVRAIVTWQHRCAGSSSAPDTCLLNRMHSSPRLMSAARAAAAALPVLPFPAPHLHPSPARKQLSSF